VALIATYEEMLGPVRKRSIDLIKCDVCGTEKEFVRKRKKDAERRTCGKSCASRLRKHKQVEKVCLYCNEKFSVDFIERSKKCCSYSCTRKLGTVIEKQCLNCGASFQSRVKKNRKFCRTECAYEYRLSRRVMSICQICNEKFSVIPSRAHCVMYCSVDCQAAAFMGEGNPFYGRKHSEQTKKQLSESIKKAWIDGKFEDMGSARISWYEFTDRAGRKMRLYGTWELRFAKFLDDGEYEFIAHPKPISYIDAAGEKHSYFPDFFVKGWTGRDCFIDTKNEFVYANSHQKFVDIRKSNAELDIVILREKDLKSLGVI
jgi:hypothetical protein